MGGPVSTRCERGRSRACQEGQEGLRALSWRLKADLARLIVVANLPDESHPTSRLRASTPSTLQWGKQHQAADDVPSDDASSVMRWADKGAAISSSERPSALTPSTSSTTAPTIINPAPST